MVRGPVLLDTNVLVYAFNESRPEARQIIKQAAHYSAAVSMLTWVEVMTGTTDGDRDKTREFLNRFEIVGIDLHIAETAARLRNTVRLKIADAVIYATALTTQRTLITFDAEHFSNDMPFVFLPAPDRLM